MPRCMHQHWMYGMHMKVCSPNIIVYETGVLLDGRQHARRQVRTL
jgi:hypothetical protein